MQVRLNWYTPEQREADHEAAIAAAKNAKMAVVFVWTRLDARLRPCPAIRTSSSMKSPRSIPTPIVVLNTSQPVALPWVDKVKAVLEMWWPGDEGGMVDRQSARWAKPVPPAACPSPGASSLADYPATDPKHPERSHKGVDGKTTYSEGVNVGYRWFDKEKHRAALCLRPRPQLHDVRILRS